MPAAWLLILPLALDTFAVSTALGMQRLDRADRLRITALFTAFEGGMPLIGAALGGAADALIGRWAPWVAVAVLAGAGLFMLLGREDDEEQVARLARSRGPVQLALGLSISLDELAIGFTLGLLGVPLGIACTLIALQAALVCQVGLRLGRRVGDRARERTERLAGLALLALAAGLVILTFTRSGF